MSPDAGSTQRSPLTKRLLNPLPPSPHRTTSQLSTISVSALAIDDSPLTRDPSLAKSSTRPSSSSSSAFEPLPSGTASSSLRKGKGKERAEDDVEISGEIINGEGDAAKELRELVRRSTNGESAESRSRSTSMKGEVHTLDPPPDPLHCRTYSPRKYYVLTNAGKPVFCSHDDSSVNNITNLIGVVQSFVEEDDRLRSIVKGRYQIVILVKAPLYLFCVSDWGEPEHVLRVHLDYIYLQILSVVTLSQITRLFQRWSNFDLSRLLEGTESFLHNLIKQCQYDFSFLSSTLQPLRMPPALRDTAAAALVPPSKFKDLLYVLLVADGRIVTLLRPRKHSIHPSDVHLLLNTLASSQTLRSQETWLPICLPKFNPAGFVHAYISFVLDDVGLVFVSADREAFEDLRAWKETVVEKLEEDKTLTRIQQCIPLHPYSISALGCPGLRHFIYKSRVNVQMTSPDWESPYHDDDSKARLMTLYQRLHDAVHARSGQSTTLKLIYMKTEAEACLAWITKPFELYLAVSPHLSKSAVVAAANHVARWVGNEEGKVFLREAPVF
ncbi:vacuolar fusion protein MON1, partial [Tremellales sp. Uapishka_1]